MAVNSISGAGSAYAAYEATATSAKTQTAEKSAPAKENANAAAVYEKTDEAYQQAQAAAGKKAYGANTEIVNRMKAENEQRTQSFVNMIQKMFGQQAKTAGIADSIWQKLASGNFTVDAETKAQAQKDISEDGYWGVKQTSSRILDFAKALAGDDPAKLDKMKAAFEKGYKQAEKTWGGKLPDISKQTYDAVLKGFDEMKNPQTEIQ